MANTLQLKRSSVAGKIPLTTDLQLGEIAINTTDGRVFTKRNFSSTDYITELLTTDSSFKTNVVCATTANITLSGTQTIDGIAVVAGDRVLVKDQSTASANGIYIVAAGAWARAADADHTEDMAGAIVAVDKGTTNGGLVFTTNWKSTDTLGTTSMTWSQIGSGSGVSSISFGSTGLTPSTATTGAVTVAGTLAVANGGTGQTTGQAAITALNGYLAITSGVTDGGTTTLTSSSPLKVMATGSSAHTFVLPAVSTLQLGWSFLIVNANSSGAITVQSSGLNAFSTTQHAGSVAEYICVSTSGTGTASWVQRFVGGSGRSGTGNPVYGFAPLLSQLYLTSANPTVGTAVQGNGAMTESINIITSTPNNPSGVTLPSPSSTATSCRLVTVINRGTNPLNVYPASGHQIDALGANAFVQLAVGEMLQFWAASSTQWYSSASNLTSASAIDGTVALANGGTGANLTATTNGVVYSTASALAITAAGTTGQALVATTGSAPSWATLTLENLPGAWVKKAVRAATTANITLSGTQTIDGVAVVAGDRVLVKDQSTASQNGIYVVAAGAWSRAADADTSAEIAGGTVSVDRGTTNGGEMWTTMFKDSDTLGTTAMAWYGVLDNSDIGTVVQAWDADLDAIAALAGTSGFLKKTGTNTWSLDTTTYAPLASPTFTGTPAAPTASAGTNTTQLATTAFVTTAVAAAPGALIRAPQILTTGTTYSTPGGCTSVYVECIGAGGAGGGGTTNNQGNGGGGGAGAYAARYFTVTPSTVYTIQIGAGGTGGTGAGGAGTATTFTVGATTLSAGGGGGGGAASTATGAAGTSGTGTNGQINVTGGAGQAGNAAYGGGAGGGSFFGSGGHAAGTTSVAGNNAVAVGAGGGGATDGSASVAYNGGNGADGRIRVWEFY